MNARALMWGGYPMLRELIPELKVVETRWVQRLRYSSDIKA